MFDHNQELSDDMYMYKDDRQKDGQMDSDYNTSLEHSSQVNLFF